jgi:hypothetical protein
MTPLQQALVRELMKPVAARGRHVGEHLSSSDIAGARAFECSAVMDLVQDLTFKLEKVGVPDSRVVYLPAPLVWIEWGGSAALHVERVGVVLQEVQTAAGKACMVQQACRRKDGQIGTDKGEPVVLPMPGHQDFGLCASLHPDWHDQGRIKGDAKLATYVYALLAIINSPAHIGRRDHAPHKGLAKQLRAQLGKAAPAERPWTEILLEVPCTEESEDGQGGERLTGAKALHYCRAHARIRLGRVEFVRGHFRGDAALGVVRSTHRVVPPKLRPTTPPEGEA